MLSRRCSVLIVSLYAKTKPTHTHTNKQTEEERTELGLVKNGNLYLKVPQTALIGLPVDSVVM